jgi:hypothetical protein
MERREQHIIRYDGAHCCLVLERNEPSVIVLRISGTDVGEFGEAPMRDLDRWLAEMRDPELFIDARDGRGATIDVSGVWAIWLGKRKAKLRAVTMLAGTRFIHLTAEFVRRFSELEGTMRISTEADAFDGALAEALQSG